MFRRPSARRKSSHQALELNLVPMLDALVTLVAFLLFSMGFMAIVVIDTPAPMIAPAEEQIKKLEDKDPPLQLTAHILAEKILISDWSGSRENHVIPMRDNPEKPGEMIYDIEAFHQKLVEIKKRHQKEKQLILKPDPGVSYESLIGLMDAARQFEKTDDAPNKKDEQNQDTGVAETDLFPEVVFGNILS